MRFAAEIEQRVGREFAVAHPQDNSDPAAPAEFAEPVERNVGGDVRHGLLPQATMSTGIAPDSRVARRALFSPGQYPPVPAASVLSFAVVQLSWDYCAFSMQIFSSRPVSSRPHKG